MPKLARQNDDRYHSDFRVSSGSTVRNYGYSNYEYSSVRCAAYGNPINQTKPIRRKRLKSKKKKSILKPLIVLGIFATVLLNALPYSFNNITKAMFIPTPYPAIKADMHDIGFPTHNYLSNNWFLGQRGFSYSADSKHAQMTPLKEGVKMPVLTQSLTNLMENYKTVNPAIFVWDYDTQNYVDINASEIYATASIIKIPVLIDVFKSIEAGQISLEDTIPLTEYFRTEGSGSLQFRAHNSEYTIDELANRMITESDNSATNMLMAKVGSMTDVNQAIRDWGLKDTYVQTWLPDLTGTNKTTARDMATMLYNIDENDKFLTPESRAKILNYMGHVHNNRLIHAGLGPGAVFLHKTGDIGKMLGDAGIVIAPNGKKYIVVILANRPHNSIAGKEFIVKASELIYNYMVR